MSSTRITEGTTKVRVFSEKIVSKDMPVFYNPVMAVNRDISVALLASLGRKHLRIADPLCASGIRVARFAHELPRTIIKSIALNDGNPQAVTLAKANMRANARRRIKIDYSVAESSKALLDGGMLDYIDIDPFGSPNPFLDAAAKRLGRKGVLAVTATDTAALCGSAVPACRRKYWAEPMHGPLMNEAALRILIRKVQLIGAQYEKALVPIFSHSTGHYVRVYLQHQGGRSMVDDLLRQHMHLHWCPTCMTQRFSNNAENDCCGRMRSAGPLWSGALWDADLATRMNKAANRMPLQEESKRLLTVIAGEAKITGWVHPIPAYGKALHTSLPTIQSLIERLHKADHAAAVTHVTEAGIRSDASAEVLMRLIRPRGAHR